MIGKCLVALAAPLMLSQSNVPPATYTNIPQIKMVECMDGSGTAWRNGVGSYVTAGHVAVMQGCEIDGEPINITYISEDLDIAVMRTKVFGVPLEIDCGGLPDGLPVAGIGYAEGLPMQRVIFAIPSDKLTEISHWKHFRTLYGDERFIPGMSGGIVINREGKVVGLVNGYNSGGPISYSLPLSETPLCH